VVFTRDREPYPQIARVVRRSFVNDPRGRATAIPSLDPSLTEQGRNRRSPRDIRSETWAAHEPPLRTPRGFRFCPTGYCDAYPRPGVRRELGGTPSMLISHAV